MKITERLSALKSKLVTFYKSNKKLFFSLVACIVVLVGLAVSTLADVKKKKSGQVSSVSVTEFAREVEQKLSDMIMMLGSVSRASVFVMVESTPTVTYLTETTERSESKDGTTVSEVETTVVFEKNGSTTSPVVVTTMTPKVTGVLIVTNNIPASTKLSIINSVSVVLKIDKSCISILQES